MARTKSLTLDEQLVKVTEEIENLENALKEKKATKKNIEEQIKNRRLAELDALISASGKSMDEIKKMLGGTVTEKVAEKPVKTDKKK